jgi:MoxR-like ATPase
MANPVPQTVEATLDMLAKGNYVADRSLATALLLALKMGRPLFLEGEAGTGKTEIGKVLSQTLGRKLIRLQCYEGLDVSSAVYERNYSSQMIEIRIAEAAGQHDRDELEQGVFSERFLIKRRCFYFWVDYPDAKRELEILRVRAPGAAEGLAKQVVAFVQKLRSEDLFKLPGVAETIDWTNALIQLDKLDLDPQTINSTLGILLKYQDDIEKIQGSEAARLLQQVMTELAAGG